MEKVPPGYSCCHAARAVVLSFAAQPPAIATCSNRADQGPDGAPPNISTRRFMRWAADTALAASTKPDARPLAFGAGYGAGFWKNRARIRGALSLSSPCRVDDPVHVFDVVKQDPFSYRSDAGQTGDALGEKTFVVHSAESRGRRATSRPVARIMKLRPNRRAHGRIGGAFSPRSRSCDEKPTETIGAGRSRSHAPRACAR